MKSTIKFILFYACLFISIFSGVAQSIPQGFTLVAYEGFDYSSGSSLLNANGGSGWTGSWANAYQDRFLKTSTTGFTYSGLTTTGLKAEFDNTCYGTCNDIAALRRTFPLQNQGVVYFQFISVFEANGGGGTPQIRLFSDGAFTGGIGSSSGTFMSILDQTGANTASSTASLNAQNLVVVRVDYTLNKTEMWINPNLSTFDYSNPTNPSAAKSGFSPSFDRFDIFIRSGIIDEITVFSKPKGLNKNGAVTSDPLQTINRYGAIGSAMGLNRNGVLNPPPVRSVGDTYQGGTIFYITAPDSDGIQHGLIRTDIITSNVSYNNTISTTIPNANTNSLNGYSDWRLPNYNEAVAICQTGGMSSGTWLMSSTVTSYATSNIEVVYKSGCVNSNLTKTYTSIIAILVRSF